MDSGKLSYNIDNVFGSTSASIQLLAHAQGCLLYVSGSFLVFYSPKLDEQVAYLRHSSSLITAIAVSADEKLLAVADRAKPPTIAVYDISSLQGLRGTAVKPMLILRGHKHNIDLLLWSPNGRYLLSISNHDGSMFLWERGECLTKNRVSKSVARAAFDSSGDLVTVGRGYLKVWRFAGGEVVRKRQEECWIMQGKVLTFGKTFSTKDFVEMVYYGEKVLLLSSDGMLCIMAARYERVEKWIDLVMPHAMGLQVVGSLAICGGDNALVKSIDLQTLTLRHKFPKPPPVSKQNVNEQQQLYYGEQEQFPACQGIMQVSDFIVTLYSGRSLFIWRLGEQPYAVRSIISHRGSVHSLSLLQEVKGDICFFGSCSEDGTVRLWHFYKKQFEGEQRSIDVAQAIGIKRNVYCRNLTRIIYSHSEMPVIRVRMLANNTIACISNQELLLYSLDNFQLLLLHNFQDEQGKHPSRILALDTNQDVIFLGDEAGKLRLYRPQGQTLVKMRQFSLEMPIEGLQVFSKRMLVYGKGRMKCLTLEGQTLLNQYNVDCAVGFGNSVIYCQKATAVVFNLTRSRKTGSVSLNHQLDSGQTVRLARSNSWLIVLLTTRNRIIITNFTCTVLYSEQLGESITDMAVAEGGELMLATESGSVVVRRQDSNRYVRMDQKVKRWFQLNDMSWMDGSVWASSQRQSHNQSHSHSNNNNSNNNNSKQLEGINIQVQNSIRINDDSVFRSVGMRPPSSDLALSYKNQQNKRSIFNPGLICAQANQIYQNVNQLMKNRVTVNSPVNLPDKSKSLKRRIFKGDQQDEKKEKEQEKRESPKGYVPAFANNLIESVIGDCPPSAITNKQPSSNILSSRHEKEVISTEDQDCVVKSRAQESSINFGFIQFEEPSRGSVSGDHNQFSYTETKNQGRRNDFLSTVDLLLQNYEQLEGNREDMHSMVLQHYDDYQKLYKLLSVQFGKRERQQWASKARQNFQKMAEGFLGSLEK